MSANPSPKKPHRLTIRLSTKTIEKVEQVAVREERAVSSVARRLIEEALRCKESKRC